MPWFTYHSGHSGQFCRHAKGELEAVVLRAIERGFSHYGLSEHSPRDDRHWFFPGEEDLTPDDLGRMFVEYSKEARRLQDLYADRIELLVGFETERLPEPGWAERMAALRAAGDFEYAVGSVHHVGERWIDFSPEETARAAEDAGGRENLEIKYFEALAELTTTLRPEVTGHIDLIRKFDGPSAAFSPRVLAHVERTLEAVREAGAVLDVNAGAYRRGLSPVYPLPSILARARQMGIGVTLGDDSHGPHDVGVGLDECLRVIAAAGYQEVHYLTHRDGAATWARAPLESVKPKQ